MTEKRFECDKGSRIIIDNETKLHYIMTLDWECSLVTKLLNNFVEENEQLKQEVTHWKKILDDYQQIVAKTLREQYHWLKNEDKILNHDKTVALLELESISARLGIDLI